jgi:ABC-type anion transport system duplicated permease subunit
VYRQGPPAQVQNQCRGLYSETKDRLLQAVQLHRPLQRTAQQIARRFQKQIQHVTRKTEKSCDVSSIFCCTMARLVGVLLLGLVCAATATVYFQEKFEDGNENGTFLVCSRTGAGLR